MSFEIDDGVRDELSRAVERSLAASQRLVEFGASICTEVCLLLRVYGAYFAPAAGVDGEEFGCYNRGSGDGNVRVGFAGEEAANEDILEV